MAGSKAHIVPQHPNPGSSEHSQHAWEAQGIFLPPGDGDSSAQGNGLCFRDPPLAHLCTQRCCHISSREVQEGTREPRCVAHCSVQVVALQMHGELSATQAEPSTGGCSFTSCPHRYQWENRADFTHVRLGRKTHIHTHTHTLQREKMTIFRDSHPTQQIKRKGKQPLFCSEHSPAQQRHEGALSTATKCFGAHRECHTSE